MTELGMLGGAESVGLGINSSGDIVGWSDLPNGVNDPFKDVGGVMTDLGAPVAESGAEAWAVNDAGQAVGFGRISATVPTHALLWDDNGYHDLGSLGGSRSSALGINNAGRVVGYSYVAGDKEYHAFLYEGGVMYDLNDLIVGNPGWVVRQAYDINIWGDIVGYATVNGRDHAVLLRRIPEPSACALFACGLGVAAGLRWKKRRPR